ncbi:hypothetical protein HPB47_026919 [Ixodes persulcatus]|uniref:Uncharacterized protein n=1 Tax=Ixodes persulcatus TaxID=34615 RepID=A0AC60PXD9_IXOPE|nr:hypothetical protein HPB47_026919 [Ixodes persulcatus]
MPPKKGPCTHNLVERWYHNPKSGSCETFIYGGCGGNFNRYRTEAECRKECIKEEEPPTAVIQEDRTIGICLQPLNVGFCSKEEKRFYYDAKNHTCKPFIYGGCAGNDNNFPTREICLKMCNRDMTRGARRPEHFGEQLDNADMEELVTHAVSLPNVVENVDDLPCGASKGDKMTIGDAAAAAVEATASPAPVAFEPEETGEATDPSTPAAFVDGEPECVAEDTSAKDSEGWQPAPTKKKNNKKKATQASEEERANKMKLRGKKNEDPSPPDRVPSPAEDPPPSFS